jgi:hypothetical protein
MLNAIDTRSSSINPRMMLSVILKTDHRCHRHVPYRMKTWKYACRLLRTSILKEEAMLHDSQKRQLLLGNNQ